MGWLLRFLETASAIEIAVGAVLALALLVALIKICEIIPWRPLFTVVLACLAYGVLVATPREITTARGMTTILNALPDLDAGVGILLFVAGVILILAVPVPKR